MLSRRPFAAHSALLNHDTLCGIIMTLKDTSPCFVCCKEFLFGGYFILTPHYFDARHGTIIYVLCRCRKMALKSRKGKNEHRFSPTSLRSSYHRYGCLRSTPASNSCIVNFISTGCLSVPVSLSPSLFTFVVGVDRAELCSVGRVEKQVNWNSQHPRSFFP